MDPTNNNSFDSFGSNSGGTGVAGDTSGVGVGTSAAGSVGATGSVPGAIVSGGATSVDPVVSETNNSENVSFGPMNSGSSQVNNGGYAMRSFPQGGIAVGGSEKRSRKGLIIAGIVLFVLAIGGGLAALAAMNGVFGGDLTAGGNVNERFNRFANYVISGEESTSNFDSEYSASEEYYFLDEIYSSEVPVELLTHVYSLWNDFENEYNRVSSKDSVLNSEKLKSVIKDEENLLIFIKAVNGKEIVDSLTVLNYYVENGKESTSSYYNDYYFSEIDSSNEYIVEFSELYSDWLNAVIKHYDLYSRNGCITNGMINLICLNEVGDDEILNERSSLINQIADYNAKIDTFYNMSNNSFIYNVFKINNYLKDNNER